jgi:hypothetical protein
MTGLRPNFRYIGTRNKEPKPYARFGYDIKPEACAGVMSNSSANSEMYGDGPMRAALPRKE